MSLRGLPVLGPHPSFATPLPAHRLAWLIPGVPLNRQSAFASSSARPATRNFRHFLFAVDFIWLTFRAGNVRFTGILGVPKKLEKFSSNPLARGGPFWYITHPLRPKGARLILENRTVQIRTRSRGSPEDGEPPEGTRNTMNEKLVVRCPEPARAPKQ